MIDLYPNWLNFPWGLDVSYTHVDNVPILAAACRKYGRFWDGEFFYQLQAKVYVIRFPDWRKRYRIEHEKVRIRTHNQPNQSSLF